MDNNILLARKLRVETNLRCDYDNGIIEKGRFATQVVGDPEAVKAQGIYHGRLCYEAALQNYQTKVKELELKERAANE